MKVIIATDKFKGSLTSFEACEAIAGGIRTIHPDWNIELFPMADGGDGFATVLKHYLHTDTITCQTEDPLGRIIEAAYELKDQTAIIEMATASGMVLLKEEERSALKASTFGTGLMIKHAIEQGAKKIILGLGGSATNDAGAGVLKALGFEFKDENGHSLNGAGATLIHIRKIIPPPVIPDIHIDIAVDVQNTLYGPQGAAYVYAPQKGATPQDVALLDQGLKNFAGLLPKDIANIPGTGAAGGIAAGLMAFFDVKLSKGIDWIINTSGIRNAIDDAGVIITGEGKIDNQSTYGKVVSEIAVLAKEHHIPAIAFCGITDIDKTGIDQLGLEDVIPIKPDNMPAAEAMAQGARLLNEKAAAYIGIFSP